MADCPCLDSEDGNRNEERFGRVNHKTAPDKASPPNDSSAGTRGSIAAEFGGRFLGPRTVNFLT